jgi:hypothetical protein
MINGSAARNQSTNASIDTEVRRFGEEMVIEKINKIFDEAKNDKEEFEESY